MREARDHALDHDRFCQLALDELPAVYRLAHHLVSCANEVEDVVQETYLHALRAAPNFELRECGIRPWLFKILHNVINARVGDRARDVRLRGELLRGERAANDLPAYAGEGDGQHQDHQISWDDVDQRLKHAIDGLPRNHKAVFLLSAIEGLRYREIAEIIGAPVGTVMSRLHRARMELASQLQDLNPARLHGERKSTNGEMKSPQG